MLKRSYATKAEIPAEYLGLYEEKDGKWVLKVEVEGLVPKEKIDEFRTNNIGLQKQLDDLKKSYEGIDPKVIKEQIESTRKKEEDLLKKEGKIDELVDRRVAAMKADYEKKIVDLETSVKKSNEELARNVIEKGLAEAAAKGKVLKTAVDDVIRRGKDVFRMVDGKPVAKAADGTDMFGKDGKALTIEGFIEQLAPSAPHLFEPTSGSGASGAGSGGGGAKKNPWTKADFNLTEQGRIVRENPAMARQLAQEAGIKPTF